MQDFDTLRDRVEAMTQKLVSAQADRESQTDSLVVILRQLEEKHAAQAQQLAYYRDRIEPLEQANQQLTALMGNLLDMIDSGFGDDSLEPLRNAASMASGMLDADLFIAGRESAPPPAAEATIDDVVFGGTDTAGEEEPPAAATSENSPDTANANDDPPEMIEDAADDLGDPAETAGNDFAEPDLEMEEDALISMDDLLDLASEEPTDDLVVFENTAPGDETAAGDMMSTDPADNESVADDPMEAEAIEAASITDAEPEMEEPVDAVASSEDFSFEDVSDAVLELEDREDEAAGYDDLPDIVKTAMEAADNAEVDFVPDIPSTDAEHGAGDESAQDDLETIAALAQAIEEETANEGSPPPAQSDIRALLMRVEALAKKAEAMRLAQGATEEEATDATGTKESAEPERSPKRAGAAA